MSRALLCLLLLLAAPLAAAGGCEERLEALTKERDELLELVKFQTDSKHRLSAEVDELHAMERELKALLELAQARAGDSQVLDFLTTAGRDIGRNRPELRAAFNKTVALIGDRAVGAWTMGEGVVHRASQNINSTLTPIVGTVSASWVTTAGTVLLVLLPLGASWHFFSKLRGAITLRGELVFLNCYLGCQFSLLFVLSFFVECGETLAAMRLYGSAAYGGFQLLMLLLFLVYLTSSARYCMRLLNAPPRGRPTRGKMLVALAQTAAAFLLGLRYYSNVWRPAMLDAAPDLSEWEHLLFALCFTVGFWVTMVTRPRVASSSSSSSGSSSASRPGADKLC